MLEVTGKAKVNELLINSFANYQNNIVTVGANGNLIPSSLTSIGAGLWQQAANTHNIFYDAASSYWDYKIGMGTNNPVTKLDVRGALNLNGYGSQGIIYFPSSGGYNLFHICADDNPGSWEDASVRMTIYQNGTLELFNSSGDPTFKVNNVGYAGARGMKLTMGTFPDYVFNENYDLKKIEEVENYIRENKHLPGLPTACEVEENGLDVGEMNAKLVQKVEELTLYLIDFKKENDKLKTRIDALEKK